MIATPVYDDSEVVELNAAYRLYLKPKTKLIISVILPEETDRCRPISNWDILEQLKNMVAPDYFSSLRVSKSTREFIRIEGETDSKRLSHIFWEKLSGQSLQISSINKPLIVDVNEAPPEFPANENAEDLLLQMVEDSGVSTANNIFPSCIHLEGLPCKWFSTMGSNIEMPNEEVVRNTFEKYGKIANIDIPMLDPYREETGGSPPIGGVLQPFHVFLQYESQSSTLDAINSLQGMKLIFTAEDGKSLACDIKISVDTSNHFSEEAVNKRTAERLALQELEQQRKQVKEDEAERKRKALERKARARKRRARLKRKLQRQKQSQEIVVQEQEACPEEAVEDTQEWEDRKLLLAQRRLESIKLLTIILDKVNDLVQVNRLEEEQMTCEFAEFSDCSVSTYSENSNVMFLPIDEEEESSQHENEQNTDDKLEIKISEEDASEHRHERRRDSFSDSIHQNNYEDDSCLEYSNDIQVPKIHYNDQQRIFKMSYTKEVSDERCSKKQKIYETDEFINYLLNHYRNPEYARLFLETDESSNRPWYQRVVVWKGNSFQIKLQTPNGHFTEMNFIPEMEEETEDDCGKLEQPIAEPEETSQEPSVCRIKASEPQKHYMDSEHEEQLTRPRPRLVKKYERVYKKTWEDEEDIESSESNYELKEVLEEISSTSEYFSEETSGISDKHSNIRRTSRKQRNVKQLKKMKHCNVSGHNPVCHHEDLLGHLLHSYCQNLKKHSRCKLTQAYRGKPSFQYDSDTCESDTDMEAKVQKSWKRKRTKIKNPACFLEEKKLKKERYSSSEDETSSSYSHLHKRNIWQKQYNGKPKRKMQKTRSCDSDEKPNRQWDLYFAEDVSDSPEQEESSCDGETLSSCSPISSHPAGENDALGGCSKGLYTDYWDWE